MKQLKDQNFKVATIKITQIKKVFKDRNSYEFKDKMWCVKVIHQTYTASTCFDCNKKGQENLIKFIREQLYL